MCQGLISFNFFAFNFFSNQAMSYLARKERKRKTACSGWHFCVFFFLDGRL